MTPLPPWARVITANNPSHMTLDGTNTIIIGYPNQPSTLIDPGPRNDPRHLDRLAACTTPTVILSTHYHPDHTGALPECHTRWPHTPTYAIDSHYATETAPLNTWHHHLPADTLTWKFHHTPGHTDDSWCAIVNDTEHRSVLIAGDTILGAGSSVIAHPDGNVGVYLQSLTTLIDWLTNHHPDAQLLPGHGPSGANALTAAQKYLQHRQQRIEQVHTATTNGLHDAAAIARNIYPDAPAALHTAAVASITAHLRYLGHTP